METQQLHKVQISVLHTIRRAKSSRYTDLMRPTGMDSDSFKFHLRKLVKYGYITKDNEGAYLLTPSGKEFANNLDRENRKVQKQPKLSVMVVASRMGDDGELRYLFQRRLRNPYWDIWGFITGPIRWGVTPENAASHELHKQTDLKGSFEVRCFYRKQDTLESGAGLIEDKQFIVVAATELQVELSNAWDGGYNAWLSLEEFKSQEKIFGDTITALRMLDTGETYRLVSAEYTQDMY